MPNFKLQSFPFSDHNICGLRTIFNFCIDAQLFLAKHQENKSLYSSSKVPFYDNNEPNTCTKDAAIAIHCKAGKGRTGLMVICFLLFSEHHFTDKENYPMNAMNYYNAKRTMNKKGLTIKSQIRYVQIFYEFLQREIKSPYFSNSLQKFNVIQGKFDSQQISNQRLIPFSLCIGPFQRPFERSKFDLDIYQLASIDNNEIVDIYRLSDQLRNSTGANEVIKWCKDTNGRYYLVLIFKFDRLNNGDQIKLGVDFKFKIKANGRLFHFWLNSDSIRHRDLPLIYESVDFTIPEDTSDEDLIQLCFPRDILFDSPKMHRNRLSSSRFSISGGNRQSIKGANREVIEQRVKEVQEMQERTMEVVRDFEEFDLEPINSYMDIRVQEGERQIEDRMVAE